MKKLMYFAVLSAGVLLVDTTDARTLQFSTGNFEADSTSEPGNADEQIFNAVEEEPQFPGGQVALMQFLSTNLRYPSAAQENGITGKVVVGFEVDKDGSICNVKILKGVDRDLDQEALRVVKKMPKWEPGRNNGEPVRCLFSIPIKFSL